MKKTVLLTLLITFICFFISGHYDARSLEAYHYIIALGIDKGDNTSLKLSIQIAESDSERRHFYSIHKTINLYCRL